MGKADSHVHSKYSFSSRSEVSDLIKAANKKGLNYMAITDTVDFSNQPVKEVVRRLNHRNFEIDDLQRSTGVRVIKGVEVSEPHLYSQEMSFLIDETEIDYVLGGIHHIFGVPMRKMSTYPEVMNLYLKALLKMVNEANIDSVAHLDYLKKHLSNPKFNEALIREILETMIKNNIALEINTSGIRRKQDLYPSETIIDRYRELGGKNVVYGSNAHQSSEVYENIDTAHDRLKPCEFDEGVVLKRKFTRL